MHLSYTHANNDVEKRELEKQKDSSSLKIIFSVFPVFLFSIEPGKKTIDNVSSKQDFQTEIETLEKRFPKCGNALRRIYRWRVLYGVIGFLFSVIKWIVELVLGSQN